MKNKIHILPTYNKLRPYSIALGGELVQEQHRHGNITIKITRAKNGKHKGFIDYKENAYWIVDSTGRTLRLRFETLQEAKRKALDIAFSL